LRTDRRTRTKRSTADGLPSPRLTIAALVGADLVALVLASFGGTGTVMAAGGPFGVAGLVPLVALAALVFLAFGLVDLYQVVGLDRVEELRRMVLVGLGAGVVLTTTMLVSIASSQEATALVPATIAAWLTVVLAPALRTVIRHAGAPKAWWGVPVVVLGSGASSERLVTRLQRSPDLGLRPIACFSEDASDHGREFAGVPVVGRFADALPYRSVGVRHALVIDPGTGAADLAKATDHGRAFPSVFVMPRLDGFTAGNVSLTTVGGDFALRIGPNRRLRRHELAKRALDLFMIVPAALVAAPLIAICAVAVATISPGNPFYYQARVGRAGRTIKVWKLRTMHVDAESLLERYLNENPAARTEWERRFKLAVDPRILPGIGTLLRRTSLDELPQLWCILRGDMSFVGPRPFPSYHLAAFGEPFRELRYSVPPGLTGLWQVSGRSEGDVRVQEELDTHYIQNWSIWMDLYVLARTPAAVLLGKGAS
jgi:Undecaprenyl-phosphate galactose phosphotransferase WbaP